MSVKFLSCISGVSLLFCATIASAQDATAASAQNASAASAQDATIPSAQNRAPGVYPGDPSEVFSAIGRRGLEGNRYYLDGNQWRFFPLEKVLRQGHPEGERLSSPGFNDSTWMAASVPSTNFINFVNAGKIAEPNFGTNIFSVDHVPFADDFWYRTSFTLPEGFTGAEGKDRVFLNFDGINWKAHVFLNGKLVGKINGAFSHGRFDVTDNLLPSDNILAVKVISNHHQGAVKNRTMQSTDANGGVLGSDNPTFHASVGWDWIPTIPGRNDGIWDNVYLTYEGPAHLSDPRVQTTLALPDTAATITPAVVLTNSTAAPLAGKLRFAMAGIEVEKDVEIAPHTAVTEEFASESYPQLSGLRMPLWWPNGMGAPVLHAADFIFTPADAAARPDTLRFDVGLRQVSAVDPETNLKVYVNGRRMAAYGGNWGFSEANLRYGQREYNTAVNLHRQQNFSLIRNWVGQTPNEEFYEACDRNGMMIWQDFWLANPGDGPHPDDDTMFTDNALELVKRIRRHPSLLLYCGRNEGNPPARLDSALRRIVAENHPDLLYIPHSAAGGVSGFGPYRAMRPEFYFKNQSGKIHSERGIPAPMTLEGLQRTFGDVSDFEALRLPMALHDFTLGGAQNCGAFMEMMEENFGPFSDTRTFAELAQWLSYESYRALFESTSGSRQGVLLWMSHPAWPSMVWQTYDYYFEPLGAFFGSKKACEPVHIQRNAATNTVEVINRSGLPRDGLKATTRLRDIHGKVLATANEKLDLPVDTTLTFDMPVLPEGFSGLYFVDQTLSDRKGRPVSTNLYLLNSDGSYDLRAIRDLPTPKVTLRAGKPRCGADNLCHIEVKLHNTSRDTPAIFLRLNLLDADGGQVLPVTYSDNYITLMPGASATLTVSYSPADLRSSAAPHVALTSPF